MILLNAPRNMLAVKTLVDTIEEILANRPVKIVKVTPSSEDANDNVKLGSVV